MLADKKPFVLRSKISYIGIFNILLGILLVITGLSLAQFTEAGSGINLLSIGNLLWGIAFLIGGGLLFIRPRLGLYFSGLLYIINITLIIFLKLYGLVVSS